MYTLKKEERLCNKRLINELFTNGSSFLCYPYRVTWAYAAFQRYPAQVVFAVPKKKFKHAVDRNLIRRRMREAYRLNKQQHLYVTLEEADRQIIVSLSYIGKVIEEPELMGKKMLRLLLQLAKEAS